MIGDQTLEDDGMTTRWKSAFRAAAPLAIASYVVTGLRLAGELRGWSDTWFSRGTGGLVPRSAVDWVVGITWLAAPFGAYLAWRLRREGAGLERSGRALALSLGAVVGLYVGARLVLLLPLPPPVFLLSVWSVGVLAAVAAWHAWPALARVLLAYGLLSRLAVALVMFFAMRGHWGTHYDYVDSPQVRELPFWTAYVALAFLPQLVFWVAFTIVGGVCAGTLVAAVTGKAPRDGGEPEATGQPEGQP
jgi:hypothetical protein